MGAPSARNESWLYALRVVHHMATARGDDDILAVFPGGHYGRRPWPVAVSSEPDSGCCRGTGPGAAVALRYLDGDSGAAGHPMMDVVDENPIGSSWLTLSAARGHAWLVFE